MANMDLVTSHRGVAHITTQNVIDLLAGLSGDISGVKIFPNLYNGLAHEITTSTRVQLKPGAGLAGGYFFILNSLYNWDLDPGAVGYSRNDILFLVIYENFGSLVQSCDLVYAPGPPYPNGSQGGEVEEIGGPDILACFKLLRAVMTDGAIVSVTSLADEYLSNENLNNKIVTPYDALENAGMFNVLTYKNFPTNIAEEAVSENEFFTYAPAGSPKQTRLAQAITEILPDEEIQNGTNAQIFSIGQLLNWLNFHTPYSTRRIRVGDVIYDNKLYQFIDTSLRIMPEDQYGGINPQTKIVHRYTRIINTDYVIHKDIYSYKYHEEDDYYFIADGQVAEYLTSGNFTQTIKVLVLTKSNGLLVGKESIAFAVWNGSTQGYTKTDITVEAGDHITTYYVYPGSGID